jgi:hypothetical protein
MPMFHEGNRDLQQKFNSTALADRLVERLRRSEFTNDDKVFIESLEYFFLATSDPAGRSDCSFKGGAPLPRQRAPSRGWRRGLGPLP